MNDDALINALSEIVDALVSQQKELDCLKEAIETNPSIRAAYTDLAARQRVHGPTPQALLLRQRLEALRHR